MLDFAIIPARGGSKRIKNKNLEKFSDGYSSRSMIFRVIDEIIHVSKNIVISSDSAMIINAVSSEFLGTNSINFEDENIIICNNQKPTNFIFIKRDSALSDDFTPTISVISNALSILRAKHLANNSNIIATIYPTAMFMTKKHILDSIKLLNDQVSFVVSATQNNSVYRSFRKNSIGTMEFIFEENILKRTQDLDIAFNDAGQFYIGRALDFLRQVPLLGEKSLIYDIGISKDIDTMIDLKIAEFLYSLRDESEN